MNETPFTLTQLPIPQLDETQLSNFTRDSIHAEDIGDFDVYAIAQVLKDKEGMRVIGADFGGDKGLTKLYIVRNGRLEIDDTYEDYVQGTHGAGYLDSLKKTAAFATENNIPVGVSWGAPLEGTRPLYHPKAAEFLTELTEQFDGDLKNVLPTLAGCINDGPAGLISGAVAAANAAPTEAVLLPINGGGLGMAALVNGRMFATEAGHVRAVDALNTYNQTTPCGVFGAEFVCIETLGANKAGIEAQWAARHGYMRALDIENEYKAGNAFAGELYDHSALVVAHMIVGTARALDIDLTLPTTVVVGHGGAFKFPGYRERIGQIIEENSGANLRFMTTFEYGDARSNACIEGAALAALVGMV